MNRSTVVLAWLLFVPMGSLCAFAAVRSLWRGQILTAVVAVGGCAFLFGMLIPAAKALRGRVTPLGGFDEAGTTIRPDRSMDVPVQVSLLGGVVASALIAVLAPLGKLDLPVPPFMRYSLPFTSAVIVAMGAPILWRNFRRGSSRYLRLTPGGFEIVQGWRPEGGDWEDVRDVTDAAPGQQTATPSAVVFVMADHSAPSLVAGAITREGAALRDWVRFYREHVDCRGELTDGRAIDRLERIVAKS